MIRFTQSHRALSTFLAGCLVSAVAAVAAHAAGRPFVPVQAGFQREAPIVAEHMPGRVLVQLTRDARETSQVPARWRFGDLLPGARTGIPAVDRVLAAGGAHELRRAFVEPADVEAAGHLGVDRWIMVHLREGRSEAALVAQLSGLREVEAASLDYVAFPAVVPADPLYSMHWGHNNTAQMLSYNWTNNNHETGSPVGTVGFDTNAQVAWGGAQGYGSSSVILAIIDSGVQTAHPDLVQVTGWDYGDNDSNPDDNSAQAGHGTACAGVAASRANSLGACGAAPGCNIMPLKVADSAGSMAFSSIVNAIYYAADNAANIISMSLGAAISSESATDAAISYAAGKGCVILAATGNENKSTISYPAINATVIGVGAASPCGDRKRSSSNAGEVNPGVSTDPNGYTCDGERWWGSNYGTTTANGAGAVDVIAPTILPTTDRLGSLGYDPSDYSKWFNGTSCATPYAAGVCALIKSANPTWTATQVADRLKTTAQDIVNVEAAAGWDRYSGYGMVDAAAAVGAGGGADVVTVTYPNGGETLTAGTAVNITWTWTGTFTTVNLDYSTNGGSTWTSIVSGTPNDGTQSWTVPSSATTQGRVRVSGGTATDQSNANFTISVPSGGSYATLPYSTSFDSGVLDSYWTTAITADGRVRLLTTNTPHSGAYHMVMDDATSGGYSQTEARLGVNLAGKPQVNMTFWWKDFGDETHTQDGIYFSSNGGSTYTKVYSLNGGSYSDNTWRSFTLDVDALAATYALALTSTFVIKFQQYDDYPISTDGFAFDDISVTAPSGAITTETESNNTSGTANGPVGTGTPVTGSVSTTTDIDYFFFDVATVGTVNISLAIGTSADLDWFLYNASLVEVARGYTTANPEAGSYANAPVGRYYLKVNGYSGAISSYTLTVTGGLANFPVFAQKTDPSAIPGLGAPAVTALLPNSPNPFRATTGIRFALAQAGEVELEIFDSNGRAVTTLAHRAFPVGMHQLSWDGRDTRGVAAPSGVYFYRLKTAGFSDTRKLLLLP